MKRTLIKSVKKLKIPPKEKVLQLAFYNKQEKKNFLLHIYLKKGFLCAVSLALIICIVLQGVVFLRNGETRNLQVVYGNEIFVSVFDEWDSDEIVRFGISDSLKKKMEEKNGEKVLFSVYIRFYPVLAYDEGFETSENLAAQISQNKAKREKLNKELYELQKIYPVGKYLAEGLVLLKELTEVEKQEMYPDLDKLTQSEKEVIKKQIDLLCNDMDLLVQEYHQLNEKENLERKEYCTDVLQREIDTVRDIIGVDKFEKVAQHSEVFIGKADNIYNAIINAKTIEAIAQRGSCDIFFALPERTGDYNEKITDSLTHYLEYMGENETIEIVAVSVYDTSLSYAFEQNLTNNISYNQEYIKKWKGFDINGDGSISNEENNQKEAKEAYINNLLKNNGILERRIVVEKFENFGFGFNAKLNKNEIIKLAENPEIRAIYVKK